MSTLSSQVVGVGSLPRGKHDMHNLPFERNKQKCNIRCCLLEVRIGRDTLHIVRNSPMRAARVMRVPMVVAEQGDACCWAGGERQGTEAGCGAAPSDSDQGNRGTPGRNLQSASGPFNENLEN
jgi:hypothetical protein